MALPRLDDYFPDWKEREELAESMIPIIGKLYRKNVVTYCYGRALFNQSVTDIMKTHRFVRQVAKNELSEFESFPVLEAISKLDLGPSHIDLGKLTSKYMEMVDAANGNGDAQPNIGKYVEAECEDVIGRHIKPLKKPQQVVLYGFGRIGRLLARLLIEKMGGGDQLILKAVVLRPGQEDDLQKRASLLRLDSVHGEFKGTIREDYENNCIIANGNVIRLIYSNDPSEVDYTEYGIDNALVIDNTGKWRDEQELGKHLRSKGVARVIVTAPGRGAVPNVVSGINSHDLSHNETILSAASCTTNAIVPVLKVVNDRYGIAHGHMETIHAYTPDQNLNDNFHKKARRGRGAPLNLVLTETGASKAVSNLLPELTGKLTANAIRVPTPNVSIAMLNLELEKHTDTDEMNTYLRDMALFSPLQRQIDFTYDAEVASTDFVGNRHACVIDGSATNVALGNQAQIYAWYDNEFGYCCQVIRVVQKWAGIKYPLIPHDVEKTGFG